MRASVRAAFLLVAAGLPSAACGARTAATVSPSRPDGLGAPSLSTWRDVPADDPAADVLAQLVARARVGTVRTDGEGTDGAEAAVVIACVEARGPRREETAAQLAAAWPEWAFVSLPSQPSPDPLASPSTGAGAGPSGATGADAVAGVPSPAALLEAMVGAAECWIVGTRRDASAWVVRLDDSGESHAATRAFVEAASLRAGPPPDVLLAEPRRIQSSVVLTPVGGGTATSLARLVAGDHRPTVLSFWADWCVPCVKEMPYLRELSARVTDVRFIGLARARPTNERVGKVLRDNRITFDQFTFVDSALFRDVFGADEQLPAFALFRDGRLVATSIGSVEAAPTRALLALVQTRDAPAGAPVRDAGAVAGEPPQ